MFKKAVMKIDGCVCWKFYNTASFVALGKYVVIAEDGVKIFALTPYSISMNQIRRPYKAAFTIIAIAIFNVVFAIAIVVIVGILSIPWFDRGPEACDINLPVRILGFLIWNSRPAWQFLIFVERLIVGRFRPPLYFQRIILHAQDS